MKSGADHRIPLAPLCVEILTRAETLANFRTSGGTAPDLLTISPGVDQTTLSPGQSFTARATVHNQGNEAAAATTLRYYRSTNSSISTADTQIGTDAVAALFLGGSSPESATVTAPGTPGSYWIGACVDAVAGESRTANQCSTGVSITVVPAFTDYPLIPGTTLIRAVHFTELRQRIDTQLVRFSRPAHTYSSPVVVGGAIRAAHLTEVYAAVNTALGAAGQSLIGVPTVTPGTTIATASHIDALRAAVLTLEGL